MLENAFLLLAGSLFLMLRITPGGSFPRPLSREEEQDCLERWAAGDLDHSGTLDAADLTLLKRMLCN